MRGSFFFAVVIVSLSNDPEHVEGKGSPLFRGQSPLRIVRKGLLFALCA